MHDQIDADDAERRGRAIAAASRARRAAGWRASRSGSAAGSPPARRSPPAACGRSRRTRRRDSSHAPADPTTALCSAPARVGQGGRVTSDDQPEQQHHQRHADGEEGHRLGIGQAELGADETRRPTAATNTAGRREYGGIGERARRLDHDFGCLAEIVPAVRFRPHSFSAWVPNRIGTEPWPPQPGWFCRETTWESDHVRPRYRDPRLDPAAAARGGSRAPSASTS